MNQARKTDIINALIDAKKRAGRWYPPPPDGHLCSKDVCDPWFLTKDGGDIYVCDYQSIHHCTPNTCNELDYGVCRISGACYGPSGVSSYDSSDSRTWDSHSHRHEVAVGVGVKGVGTKGHARVSNEKNIVKKIEAIIVEILYGNKRNDINVTQQKTALRKFKKQRELYIQTCIRERAPINLIHIEILYKYHFNNAECIQIEQYNYNRVIYYKELANQLIAKIIKFMNGHVPIYTVESVTIALLYYMKTGYMYEGIEVIPPDEYLRDMLPPIRDLNKMGFDKKHVTKGQQLITRTYAIAATKAISMHDMALVLPDVDNNVELMRATRQKTTTTIK